MYLFLGVSASVSSHTVLAAVLLLIVQAILNCYRTGSCCLAMVSMQVAAWLKHRVSGQGWDCCCQAGRSSRNRQLTCCNLNAQLWSDSEAHLDKIARTHIFLQAYLLPSVEMDIQVSKHAQKQAEEAELLLSVCDGSKLGAFKKSWTNSSLCNWLPCWSSSLEIHGCCQSYLCFANCFDRKAWSRRKEKGNQKPEDTSSAASKSLQLAITARPF